MAWFIGTSSDFIPPTTTSRAPPVHEDTGGHAIQPYPTAPIWSCIHIYKKGGDCVSHLLLSFYISAYLSSNEAVVLMSADDVPM